MIEKTVLDYLNARLTTANAYVNVPYHKNPGQGLYVVIERTGTQRTDMLYASVIAVQSYAPSLFQAAELDEEVRNVMFGLPNNAREVSGIRLIGGSNFTDPEQRQPRYQAVFEIYHY